jgi:hypothetical protein
LSGQGCAEEGWSGRELFNGCGAQGRNKDQGVVLGEGFESGGKLGNEVGRRRRQIGVVGVEGRGGKLRGLCKKYWGGGFWR